MAITIDLTTSTFKYEIIAEVAGIIGTQQVVTLTGASDFQIQMADGSAFWVSDETGGAVSATKRITINPLTTGTNFNGNGLEQGGTYVYYVSPATNTPTLEVHAWR